MSPVRCQNLTSRRSKLLSPSHRQTESKPVRMPSLIHSATRSRSETRLLTKNSKSVGSQEFHSLLSSTPPPNQSKALSPLTEQSPAVLNTSFCEDPSPVPPPEQPKQPEIMAGCNRIAINNKCYSVVDTIGSGGSAKVYRAFDENKQLVAIKRVDITDAAEVEAQGFRNEIQLLNKLKGNSRIVTLYDSEERSEENGKARVLYMVMEHGEKDLARLLKEVIAARISSNGCDVRSALTDAKVKFYWEEMLEAVQVSLYI